MRERMQEWTYNARPSVVAASFGPAKSPEFVTSVHMLDTQTAPSGLQVRWQAVTQTWWAGVGQRGRSFNTEEEAAMYWSAEFEDPCDG